MRELFLRLGFNLILAAVPALLSLGLKSVLARTTSTRWRWAVCAPLVLAWLCFLPNACYPLTEWRYLALDPRVGYFLRSAGDDQPAMLHTVAWTIFLTLYSTASLLLYVAAVRPAKQWLAETRLGTGWGMLLLGQLTALGLYVGFVHRLNSWDLLSNASEVISRTLGAVTSYPSLIAILACGLLLWGLYSAFEVLALSLAEFVRQSRVRRSALWLPASLVGAGLLLLPAVAGSRPHPLEALNHPYSPPATQARVLDASPRDVLYTNASTGAIVLRCPLCSGAGQRPTRHSVPGEAPCPRCYGSGWIQESMPRDERQKPPKELAAGEALKLPTAAVVN